MVQMLFRAASGSHDVVFTQPGDWATTSVNSIGPYDWIRARLTAITTETTQPKGYLGLGLQLVLIQFSKGD